MAKEKGIVSGYNVVVRGSGPGVLHKGLSLGIGEA